MCMLTAKAQASMGICADSLEYSLQGNAICTKSARAGRCMYAYFVVLEFYTEQPAI